MSEITLLNLTQNLSDCHECSFHKDAIGSVFYSGQAAPLMLVGEGPGEVEDKYGIPLVGPSGQLLDKALLSVGITRDCVYTTNVIKCRPKYNRTPTAEEAEFCADKWLATEIAVVQPKIIVALGSVALKYFYGPQARITKHRGQWFNTKFNIPAIATYHPAYLLRLQGKALINAKWEVYYDLKEAVTKCKTLAPEYKLCSSNPVNLLELHADRYLNRHKK